MNTNKKTIWEYLENYFYIIFIVVLFWLPFFVSDYFLRQDLANNQLLITFWFIVTVLILFSRLTSLKIELPGIVVCGDSIGRLFKFSVTDKDGSRAYEFYCKDDKSALFFIQKLKEQSLLKEKGKNLKGKGSYENKI